MRATKRTLGAAVVVGIAFFVGRSSRLPGAEPTASAGPTWDAGSNTWVESTGGALVLWKMDGQKVASVTVHYLSSEPALYDLKAPAKDGKTPEPIVKFPAGDYVFTRTYAPAPAGMPEPAGGPLSHSGAGARSATSSQPAAAAPAAVPVPGGKACGAGKCG